MRSDYIFSIAAFTGRVWRIVSEDSSEMEVFPADCPHPVPCGVEDTWEFPAYGQIYLRNYNEVRFIVTAAVHQGLDQRREPSHVTF